MQKLDLDIEKIRKCAKTNEIGMVILYGSQATGAASLKSDVDVGVYSKKSKIDHKYFSKILNEFIKIFGEKLDFVFINQAPPLLKRHMALYGKALYEENSGIFDKFKVEASHLYADTKKFRDLNSLFIENFLEGVMPIVR